MKAVRKERKVMHSVSLEEAASLLPQLIQEARAGEDVVITENNLPVARLVSTIAGKPKPAITPEQITRIIHCAPIDPDLIVEDMAN
jgi:prevent-host-death family protein